jgi:hypothetical protein
LGRKNLLTVADVYLWSRGASSVMSDIDQVPILVFCKVCMGEIPSIPVMQEETILSWFILEIATFTAEGCTIVLRVYVSVVASFVLETRKRSVLEVSSQQLRLSVFL